MAFISVTRLRARSIRFLPTIVLHTLRSRKQLREAPGFIGGYLATSPQWAFWTVTVWTDEASMKAYRNSGSHLRAMPKLIGSCDEAAVAHWTSAGPVIPQPDEVARQIEGGRTSKVRYPSAAHAAGQCWSDGQVPRKGPSLP